MGHFKRHMGPMGHHGGCGCPACGGRHRECKKKMLAAMIFFGMMAIGNMIIVCLLHMALHAKDVMTD